MKQVIIYCFLALLLISCSGSRKISLINLANHYDETGFTRVNASFFLNGQGNADIFVGFNLNDLVYEQETSGPGFLAHYSIQYKLFLNFEDSKILDSATSFYTDSVFYGLDKTEVHRMPLKRAPDPENVLQIIVEDLNAKRSVDHFLRINAGEKYGSNSFMIMDTDSFPMINTIIDSNQFFYVLLNDPAVLRLHVRYYHRDFPIAYPPFWNEIPESFRYSPDSLFAIPMKNGWSGLLSLIQEGIYQFQVDTTARQGFTLFRFYKGFPEIATSGQLLEPLRYISSQEEYEALRDSENPKVAVDRFWLDNAGNQIRARNMIKKYYSRVVEANKLFSSYLEGWKTDRGLIYIIFGPPSVVYRANFHEEWIYGETGHSSSIKFQFFQVENPFTDNDFILYRMPSYKERWYNVVSGWRR